MSILCISKSTSQNQENLLDSAPLNIVITSLNFKVEVRYNLPTTRGEICKFVVKTTVKEIKEENPGELFGPLQEDEDDGDDGKSRVEKKKEKKKKNKNKRKRCKGKNKNKKRCRPRPTKKPKRTTKPTTPLPKHQPVKSIHLKICTR